MNFDPKDMEVKTLFRTYDCFHIPFFQRDYSWDKPYYSRFLDDIIGRITTKDGNLVTTPYFIGTMVLIGNRSGGEVEVVDGQQRLTVITILLSAISAIFCEKKQEELCEATFKYIKEVDDDGKPKSHLVSVTSYPYLECYIQSKEKKYSGNPKNEEEENIKETYEYFYQRLEERKIRKEIFGSDKFTYADILKTIRDQVLSSMTIAIRTSDRDSAFMIFEILNAKGKNLASIDLIKNIIFETMHNDPNGGEDKALDLWENVKQILRTRNNSIGFATFYRHYWISKYKKITNSKLYDSFKLLLKPKSIDTYMNFLNNLNKEAEQYIQIVSPQLKDYYDRKEYAWLVESLKAINLTFGTVQARIALLALFDVKDKNLISSKKFKETLIYLENFLFSYIAIGSQRANIFESIFSKFAIEVRNSNSKSETNIIIDEKLINRLEARYINYDIFEENFIRLEYKKENDPKNTIAKYALNKISSYYDNRDIFHDNSSIEHIIPEAGVTSLNIGNLICLEEKLNEEANNLSYEEKKEVYSNSKYAQVGNFIKKYDNWTEKNISSRAKELSSVYYTKILKKKK